jgi:hypothetical protein
MARLPTNVSLFGEYLTGKQDAITEKDFTPQELSEMLRMIEQQDFSNSKEEEDLSRSLKFLKEKSERPDGHKGHLTADATGKLVPTYTEESYNTEIQGQIKDVEKKLHSYEKTRNKTSVEYRGEREDAAGLSFIDTIAATFSSPAYNIETSLGQFNAFKNEDGSVTVKDTYDFYGTGYTEDMTVSLGEFIKHLPLALTKPEAFGTLLSRFALPSRQRDVNIELKAKNAKTFKDAL